MCQAVSLLLSDIPDRYHAHEAITGRFSGRGEDAEVRFFFNRKPFPPLLPIMLDGQFRIVRWGNRQKRSAVLPVTGWVSKDDLEQGIWQNVETQDVVIIAQAALERGVWFPVREGIAGLFVVDEKQVPTVYVKMEAATKYYTCLTKATQMPMLIGEVI